MRNLLLFMQLLCYSDPEIEELWKQIPDMYHPKLENFRLIETYISNGKRPYLDSLERAPKDPSQVVRLARIRSFKFIGPADEMPIFEVHRLNISKETENRCILIFGSHNSKDKPYSEYARNAIRELERIGYSGHVLLRIGGFPGLNRGTLMYSYVPYAFKVAFFQEARELGYREVFWMDSAMHPLRDLEWIFEKIRKEGYFCMSPGHLDRNYFPKEASDSLSIPESLFPQIPHIQSGILGFNMEDEKAIAVLDGWEQETARLLPNVTFFPEELSLSAVAWRLGIQPTCPSGDVFCIGHEIQRLNVFKDRPNLQFYVGELTDPW